MQALSPPVFNIMVDCNVASGQDSKAAIQHSTLDMVILRILQQGAYVVQLCFMAMMANFFMVESKQDFFPDICRQLRAVQEVACRASFSGQIHRCSVSLPNSLAAQLSYRILSTLLNHRCAWPHLNH